MQVLTKTEYSAKESKPFIPARVPKPKGLCLSRKDIANDDGSFSSVCELVESKVFSDGLTADDFRVSNLLKTGSTDLLKNTVSINRDSLSDSDSMAAGFEELISSSHASD